MLFKVLPLIGGVCFYLISIISLAYSLSFIGVNNEFAVDCAMSSLFIAFVTFLVTDTSDKSII